VGWVGGWGASGVFRSRILIYISIFSRISVSSKILTICSFCFSSSSFRTPHLPPPFFLPPPPPPSPYRFLSLFSIIFLSETFFSVRSLLLSFVLSPYHLLLEHIFCTVSTSVLSVVRPPSPYCHRAAPPSPSLRNLNPIQVQFNPIQSILAIKVISKTG
jgi:hypothetical protein